MHDQSCVVNDSSQIGNAGANTKGYMHVETNDFSNLCMNNGRFWQ